MKIKNLVKLLILPVLAFTACKSGDEKVDYEVTTDTLSENVRTDILMIRSSIPQPSDMTSEIAAAKINYNKSILNSTSKSSGYSSNFQKAVGLGVYGADLGYALSYNQTQDVMEFFGSISKLAKDLGLESIFDEELIGKMKDNMGKKDTLLPLINEAYDRAERNLKSNQRVATAALMAAGGWMEAIYVTSSTLKNLPNETKTKAVYDKAWNHVSSFQNVIKLLEEYKSNADCAKMLEELKEFRPFVDRTTKQGGGTLTQEDMVAINEKITAIRNKLI
jgi:hypothetical protein